MTASSRVTTAPPATTATTTTTAWGPLSLTRTGGRSAFRLSRPAASGILRPRLVAVCAVMAIATFAVFCLGIAIGDYPIGVTEVVPALWGSGDPGSLFVVRELRLPRALAGLLGGAAFGISGAVFQTMTRNPLASPDMIGITAGAQTAVVAGIVVGFGAGLSTQLLGLVGSLATALLIYLLAWKAGGTSGYRIILVGIGVSWICTSLTDYLLAKGRLAEASQAVGWLVGNLNGRSFDQVRPLALAMIVLVPCTLALSGVTRTLQMGDEVASGLGIPVQRARLALMLTAVGLVAFATATAGPIVFVPLVAPQITQRLANLAWPPPLASGLTGALIVLSSDLLGRQLLPDTELPVGVVTGVLGAPFLLWLLSRANRTSSGG